MFSALYKLSKHPVIGFLVNIVGYGYLALWNRIFSFVPSYHFRYMVAKYMYGVKIGKSNIHSGVRMLSPWNIKIGDHVNVQMDCFLDGRGGIVIGNNVDITLGVKILTQQHDIQSPTYETVSREVKIGDDVVIGSFSLILPGVELGHGVVIAAGSVVPKSIPSFEMHAGNPAVFKRKRSENINYRLNYQRPFH